MYFQFKWNGVIFIYILSIYGDRGKDDNTNIIEHLYVIKVFIRHTMYTHTVAHVWQLINDQLKNIKKEIKPS